MSQESNLYCINGASKADAAVGYLAKVEQVIITDLARADIADDPSASADISTARMLARLAATSCIVNGSLQMSAANK